MVNVSVVFADVLKIPAIRNSSQPAVKGWTHMKIVVFDTSAVAVMFGSGAQGVFETNGV